MDVVFFLDQLSIRKSENFIRIIYFVVFVKLWEENLVITFFTMLNS